MRADPKVCGGRASPLDLRRIQSYVFTMNGIFHAPKRFAPLLLAALTLALASLWAAPACADKDGDKKKDDVVWGEMPAGAKTTYIGIHGGTVPVSLLTAGDGSPMIALVGLTGSDFLNFLRTSGRLQEEPLFADNSGIYAPGTPAGAESVDSITTDPASANATIPQASDTQDLPATEQTIPSGGNATLLLAGSSSGDIPVIYATGRTFERLSLVPANWAPFGLTEKALSVEGEIKVLTPPKKMPKRQKRKKKDS